ncbi:ATP-grasp domain-containing protein [Bradyrhizobium sp. 177]|uniref:ATP-grasp domain-containing protein n=1 Tax=Bradyrhizobium sp. 177 TaxID=2782647 RepID=UPI001FF906CD|nr:ATP-grasp domain-containing protein [Bradyrhizobium sp. 177]MCK1552320.1 ATP-grasp domain-containing protein [Bradyrhizobium sp. 177]
MTHVILESIRHSLQSGRCVPIVGAGISIQAGGPSWAGHLVAMADGLSAEFSDLAKKQSSDPTELATLLTAERHRNWLPDAAIQLAQPGALHRALARWRCPLYLTTNFDNGLERAIENADGNPTVLLNDQLGNLDLSACLGRKSNDWRPFVVKLCASSSRPNPGAETREDFARLILSDRSALECLVIVLRTSTVVFLGCGMGDPLLNAALDECFVSKLGRPAPIAVIPTRTRPERKKSLEMRGVRLQEIGVEQYEKKLQKFIETCAPGSSGTNRILIFEPGMPTKLSQLLSAIERCNAKGEGISTVGIVTAHNALAQAVRQWGENQLPAIRTELFVVRDVQKIEEVNTAVLANAVPWNALVAPYEYATLNAAEFAERYIQARGIPLRTHAVATAQLSRKKDRFKAFLQEKFSSDDLISPTCFESILIPPDGSWETLLAAIRRTSPALSSEQVVVKPIDASGSAGVRPLNLTDLDQCERELSDLLRVLRAMPVDWETAHCDTTSILVEERLHGEEFSVESRHSNSGIQPIAAHWKVDIDSDKSRFFERLFVTVPSSDPTFAVLARANEKLLRAAQVSDGVFHAEYRMTPGRDRVFPLEVGLRPGGGMVNYSVLAARGIDLYEASVLCALGKDVGNGSNESIVATGLVFASTSDGGVLPPIRFSDDSGNEYAIANGDVGSLKERLQLLIRTADRKSAKQRLNEVLDRTNEICEHVKNAFEMEGTGLSATIDFVELWVKPGEVITEEEATYVAGLRIVADPSLPPPAAMAECIAAMRLSLDHLKCEPERPLRSFSWKSSHESLRPDWWQHASDNVFGSEIDSWTYSRALAGLLKQGVASVLDLGCGTAKPAIPLIGNDIRYLGVDVQDKAIREARANVAKLSRDHRDLFLLADVLDERWLNQLPVDRWDAVVGNLPYLPGPPNTLRVEVDGGSDGLRFSPGCVLKLASTFRAKFAVVNISSLANMRGFAEQVSVSGFKVVNAVGTVAPLEGDSLSVLSYLESAAFAQIFGSKEDMRQVIYSFTLSAQGGISIWTSIEQIHSALKPDAANLRTMVEGVSCW